MNFLLFVILIFFIANPTNADIRLASFYTENTLVDSNLERIADIIQRYDFVAIQGFRETKLIDPLVSILFRRGDYYKFIVSNPTGKNGKRYAFAWRDKKIQIASPPRFIDTQLEHKALIATFRSDKFDFIAINFQSLSTKDNTSKLLNTYHESNRLTPDELDVIIFAALPGKILPKLSPLVQVIPESISDTVIQQELFPTIYLNKKNTREFTGNAQQANPSQLIFDSNKNTLYSRLGWAEFNNSLIDDDPKPSLIRNHGWGKTKIRFTKNNISVK